MKNKKEEIKQEELKEIVPVSEIPNKEIFLDDGEDDLTFESDGEDSETFFKEVVKAMDDKENLSQNTEYLTVKENFTASKLVFLGKYANMPYLVAFMEQWKKDRVSFMRKGRQEKVMILNQRVEEVRKEEEAKLSKQFNVTN